MHGSRPGGFLSTWRAWSAGPPARPFRDLHLAGAAGIGLYALAAVFFTLTAGTKPAAAEPVRWALVAGLLAAFAAGYRAVRAVPDGPRVRRLVAGYAVLLTAAAAAVPAFHSTDLSVYVNLGWQQAGYGVNPYRTVLYETPNGLTDPMFFPSWQFVPCSYGFLFALQVRAACELSGSDHLVAVGLLKGVAAATLLAAGAVAWAGGRALGRPDPTRGAYLVLWHPLLLLHGVSNAHNDIQLALGVGVAVVGFARGWWPVVFPALAAATLVKYLSAAVVPFFVVASVRRFGWGRTGVGLLAAGGLVAACWWPYRDGFDAAYLTRMGDNLTAVHNSLASAALFPYEVVVRPDPVRNPPDPVVYGAVKAACWGGFAAFVGVLLVGRVRTGGSAAGLARDAVLVLLAAVLFSPKFHAWYLGMILPLAVLLPAGSRVRAAVLALGVANLLSFTFVAQAHLLNAVVMLGLPVWLVLRTPPAGRRPGPVRIRGRRPSLAEPV